MTPPQYKHACKLCSLYERNKELFYEVHLTVLQQGHSFRSTVRWLNTQLDKFNDGLKEGDPKHLNKFSASNVSMHFKHHVWTMDQVDFAMEHGFGIRTNRLVSPGVLRPGQLALKPVGRDVDDYLRLRKLVEAAERRLSDYEIQYLAARKPVDGVEGPASIDLKEVQLFQKLIKELMSMKKDLADFQSREVVAGSAVREAIEQIVSQTMAQLKDVLIEMQTNLSREMPGSSLPTQMNTLVLSKTGAFVKELVPTVLNEVTERYKLK